MLSDGAPAPSVINRLFPDNHLSLKVKSPSPSSFCPLWCIFFFAYVRPPLMNRVGMVWCAMGPRTLEGPPHWPTETLQWGRGSQRAKADGGKFSHSYSSQMLIIVASYHSRDGRLFWRAASKWLLRSANLWKCGHLRLCKLRDQRTKWGVVFNYERHD